MSTKPHKTGNGALMRRFLPYLIKYKGVLFFDLFCAALTTLCDIALPTIMRTLTNTVSAAALTVDISSFPLSSVSGKVAFSTPESNGEVSLLFVSVVHAICAQIRFNSV